MGKTTVWYRWKGEEETHKIHSKKAFNKAVKESEETGRVFEMIQMVDFMGRWTTYRLNEDGLTYRKTNI